LLVSTETADSWEVVRWGDGGSGLCSLFGKGELGLSESLGGIARVLPGPAAHKTVER
jgi:hypothetical protein